MADFKFDLENFVRAYIDLNNESKMYADGQRNYWGYAVQKILNPGGSLESFFQEHRKFNSKSVNDVLNYLDAARGKKESVDVANTIKFVAEQVFCPKMGAYSNSYDNTSYLQMFLNRLNQFKDKDLVYDVLKLLKAHVDYKHPSTNKYGIPISEKRLRINKDIATMLANNYNATMDDIAEMIYFAETPDAALKIINDVFAKTDEDLEAELNKDVPGTDAVSYILSKPKFVVRTVLDVRDLGPELSKQISAKDSGPIKEFYKQLAQWEKIATEKYDFDKVIGSGDTQYVTNYEDTLEEQNIRLINQIEKMTAEMEALKKQVSVLEQSRDQYKENYEREKDIRKRAEERHVEDKKLMDQDLKIATDALRALDTGVEKIDKANAFTRGKQIIEVKATLEKYKQDKLQHDSVVAEVKSRRNAEKMARHLGEKVVIEI